MIFVNCWGDFAKFNFGTLGSEIMNFLDSEIKDQLDQIWQRKVKAPSLAYLW